MNTHRMPARKTAPDATQAQIKPIPVTLTSDLGLGVAANADDDVNAGDDRSVNPLWMITIGLAVFFAFVAVALTFN